MMLDLEKLSGIGKWTEEKHGEKGENRVFKVVDGKAFLVVRPKTLEVRCEERLGRKLMTDYESVMESRYFGRGGIEIIPTGQLSEVEIEDLVRLSYNLTRELTQEGS